MQPLQPAQYQLLKWVDAFRWNGHLFADINPLKSIKKEQQSDDTNKEPSIRKSGRAHCATK